MQDGGIPGKVRASKKALPPGLIADLEVRCGLRGRDSERVGGRDRTAAVNDLPRPLRLTKKIAKTKPTRIREANQRAGRGFGIEGVTARAVG